jgi:nucleoid-associated protein YgaU
MDDTGMTRETKVGLLIGLGLILFIGIIVSDHLSQVQHPETNNLTRFADQAQQSIADAPPLDRADLAGETTQARGSAPTDARFPHAHRRSIPSPQEAEIIAEIENDFATRTLPLVRGLRYNTADAVADQSQTVAANGTTDSEQANVPLIERVRDIQTISLTTSPPLPRPGSTSIHYVKPGESVWGLAQKYLGDGNKWPMLREHNPDAIGPNGMLQVGARLIIPDRSVVANRPMVIEQRPATRPGSVVVKLGDTLSGLALQHMGSSRLWPKLLAANRKQLDDPEDLRVGMKLVIPATTSQVVGNINSTRPRVDAGSEMYTVQPNDNLSRIARKVRGDARLWDEIFQANKDTLSDPDDLRVGQKLRIPR